MRLTNIPFLLMLLFIGNCIMAQETYLSTDSGQTILRKYKDNEFSSAQTFAENIMDIKEFEVLSGLFKAEDIKQEVESKESVTIFAMLDSSFAKLSSKEKEALFGEVTKMKAMVYHLTIPGRIDKHGLEKAVENLGGSALLATLQGEPLRVTQKNGQLYVHDNNNNSARIVAADYFHKNGIFHIIEGMIWLDSKE